MWWALLWEVWPVAPCCRRGGGHLPQGLRQHGRRRVQESPVILDENGMGREAPALASDLAAMGTDWIKSVSGLRTQCRVHSGLADPVFWAG